LAKWTGQEVGEKGCPAMADEDVSKGWIRMRMCLLKASGFPEAAGPSAANLINSVERAFPYQ